jgi:aryl-alcohol dehydrogenase-like predicted oxidoreductase
MKTRRIGSLIVSEVGLGCNNFGGRLDYAATEAVVQESLRQGITFFDTADIYGGTKSEEFLGRALAGHRREVVVATKFGMPVDADRKGARPAYVRQALEDSLQRLRTDWIDLYQLHQPDPETPIADTLGTLDELVRAGKIREIGCSNFSASQLLEAESASGPDRAHFVGLQNQYSVLHRDPEREELPLCERLGIAFVPYFPLASGLLTGKYGRGVPPPPGSRLSAAAAASRFITDERLDRVEAVSAFAASRGHSILELAISWLLARRVVGSVITGATKREQIRANVKATTWQLTVDDLAEIDRMAPAP